MDASVAQRVAERAESLFREDSEANWRETDRRFFWIYLVESLGAVAVAAVCRREALAVDFASFDAYRWAIVCLAALTIALPLALTRFRPGEALTRHAAALGQMLLGAFLFQLSHGHIAAELYLYGSLALLALYRDWKVLLTATLLTVIDHGARCALPDTYLHGLIRCTPVELSSVLGGLVFENLFLSISIFRSLQALQRHGAEHASVESLLAAAIAESKQESDTIMATINQGLCLLGANFRIGKNYSKALEEILASGPLQNHDFLQLLRRILPEGMFSTVKDYLTLMFDAKKREKQLLKLNPLAEVEVALFAPDGAVISKHLEFRFNRVVREGKVSHLLVAVSDVTARVRLQQQLKESEDLKEKQLDLLLGALHVEPAALQEFIAAARGSLSQANAALKEEAAEHDESAPRHFQKKLEIVFREVHSVKGIASLLRLEYFETRAHELEDKIAELRQRPHLSGEDFLPIVLGLAAISADLENIALLVERLLNMHHAFSPRAVGETVGSSPPAVEARPHDHVLRSAASLVDSLSAKLGKEAVFVCERFDAAAMPEKHHGLFKEIVAQLVRNSLTHGIEPPQERSQVSKQPCGVIELCSLAGCDTGAFEFLFRDDGRGLNPYQLQSKAVELGLLKSEEAETLTSESLAALIFEPGFSTFETPTSDAGRGIGMDLIKTRVVDELGGEIRISSAPGQFCQFHIILPN